MRVKDLRHHDCVGLYPNRDIASSSPQLKHRGREKTSGKTCFLLPFSSSFHQVLTFFIFGDFSHFLNILSMFFLIIPPICLKLLATIT